MPVKNPQNYIRIRGARVHNLKNIDLDIPKNKLVVITGVSGSGKSSLAFDTLYAEGQRRYVESLSAYARQFLGVQQKPDCDKIEGISPAISIDQRKASHNPRSTVGTTTEIYDYLRVLFAKIGEPHCPKCQKPVARQTIDQIIKQVLRLPQGCEFSILGPVVQAKKGEHKAILQEIAKSGFARVRINGVTQTIDEALQAEFDKNKKRSVEVVVDRLVLDKDLERSRLADSLEIALKLGKGIAIVQSSKLKVQSCSLKLKVKERGGKTEDIIFSERFACEDCGISMPDIEPRLFSFNSPFGACPACQGLGKKLEVVPDLVMPNENLSISEGAIFPWARASHKLGRQGYFWYQLEDLAVKQGFSLNEPVKKLSADIKKIILYGSKDFVGVIPNLEKRYWETDSDATREEIRQYMRERLCDVCLGRRLKKEALAVTISGQNISGITEISIAKAKDFFEKLPKLDLVANPLLKEIISRLQFLLDVGLDYLSLSRETATLSGGEEQRTRLATQLGSQLTGVLYILDEPSVGLHQRDQQKLIATLKKLKDLGNTVIVVEHDKSTVLAADWVIDIGPGAGKNGGKVMFQGTAKQLLASKTLTGEYLSGRKKIVNRKSQKNCHSEPAGEESLGRDSSLSLRMTNSELCRPEGNPEGSLGRDSSLSLRMTNSNKFLEVKGARENNLKNIDIKIPLGKFVCVSGVSGSGKSSLVNDVIAKALYKKFYHSKDEPGKHTAIFGTEFLDKVVLVNQDPIGRTPRSNPATYTGSFNVIRDIFAKTKEAKIRGYLVGRFSFNVKGGRCEACEGQGVKKIEMYFLPDVFVVCDECLGKRYNQETLQIKYKDKSIADVLDMTVEEALKFFENFPALKNKLKTLSDVGLGYVGLGQAATSLSGGEAQRVKLATELSKQSSSKTMYILDEPTTGLHPDDINKLLFVLRALVDKGNTVLVVEHNLDLIASSDWVCDLGPDSGDNGGYLVAEGTPADIAKAKASWTGKYLRQTR